MKKFDWFMILGSLAIAITNISMIAQGGWWFIFGLIFTVLWVWTTIHSRRCIKSSCVGTMKKFDWFTIIMLLAIAENTICFIIQGGWLAVMGLIFGGVWAWVAYWDWKRYQTIKSDSESLREMCDVFRRINNTGVTIDEFSSALNNACLEPRFIGDVTCKNNARSPYLRCAINPDGPCHECKNYRP